MRYFLAAILTIIPAISFAADGWHVGPNTRFIEGYLLQQNRPGTHVSSVVPLTIPQITNILGNAKGTGLLDNHIGIYREIIEFDNLVPTGPNDRRNWPYIDAVLDVFKGFNGYLILTIGQPFPSWVTPIKNGGACWVPTAEADFIKAKNSIDAAFGDYIGHYAGRSAAHKAWVTNRLIVEALNEMDGQVDYATCSNNRLSTPARAAALANGIVYMLNTAYNLYPLQILGPSYAGTYSGSYSNGCAVNTAQIGDQYRCWHTDYRANYGPGPLNMHAYYGPVAGCTTAACIAGREASAVAWVNASLGSPNNIWLTEFGLLKGNAAHEPPCSDPMAVSVDTWNAYPVSVIGNPVIVSATSVVLQWQWQDIPSQVCGSWGWSDGSNNVNPVYYPGAVPAVENWAKAH